MIELLTTRQVQDLLKVDRITIYRMLQDGRLKGVKIGQQWRFQQAEVERLLNGEVSIETPIPYSPSASSIPVHCLQTIQNLFSSVSQIGSLVIDPTGEPLTALSGECSLCRMLQETPSGAQACRQSWRTMAAASATGEREFTCHAGLTYLSAPVLDGEAPAGWLLAGQVRLWPPSPEEQTQQAHDLARSHGLPAALLQESIRQTTLIPFEKQAQLHSWVLNAAKAMESILKERSGFMQRMQQIADLTQVG